MVAYNFQARFAPLITTGEKNQTIRPVDKRRHARAGEPVQLYTGMRTKACRKLRDPDPLCRRAVPCEVREDGASIDGVEIRWLSLLADKDGFPNWPSMQEFFRENYGLPFTGVLIEWEG